jgi:hypothetical protein
MHSLGLLISPPTGLHGNSTAATVVLTGTLVALAAAAGWGIARRRWLLIALLTGGLLAGFVESQLDLLSRIWWASNLPNAYTTFGRPIPLIVPFTYSLVIGGGAYLAYALCARGASRKTIVQFGVAFSVLEPIFEMLLMTTHFYKYYGPQPIRVFGYPMYWGAINGVGATSAGVLVYLWRNAFAGRNAALAVLVIPLAFGMDFAFGWPLFDVMNTHASELTMSLVSLLPIALCAGELWLVSSYIGRRTHGATSDPQLTAEAGRLGPIEVADKVPAGAGA